TMTPEVLRFATTGRAAAPPDSEPPLPRQEQPERVRLLGVPRVERRREDEVARLVRRLHAEAGEGAEAVLHAEARDRRVPVEEHRRRLERHEQLRAEVLPELDLRAGEELLEAAEQVPAGDLLGEPRHRRDVEDVGAERARGAALELVDQDAGGDR